MTSNMTCWQVLGIAPTEDKKQIKRTYSKLLKMTRPEDDIEAFQTLNEAYEQALSWDFAAEPIEYDDQLDELEDVIEQGISDQGLEDLKSLAGLDSDSRTEVQGQTEDEPLTTEQKLQNFESMDTADVIGVIFDEFGRLLEQQDDADWDAFLALDVMNDLEHKPAISFELFASLTNYVQEHNELPIKARLARRFAEHFMWFEQELDFCQYLNSDAVGQTLFFLQSNDAVKQVRFFPPAAKEGVKPRGQGQANKGSSWKSLFWIILFVWFVIKILFSLA